MEFVIIFFFYSNGGIISILTRNRGDNFSNKNFGNNFDDDKLYVHSSIM